MDPEAQDGIPYAVVVSHSALYHAKRERREQKEKYKEDVACRYHCVSCLNGYVWAVIFGNIVIACGFLTLLIFGVESVIGRGIQSIF